MKAVFENAGQLVTGNQVRVGGRPVGTIDGIELNDERPGRGRDDREEELAPLHEGTTATISATSLSGIANRYVSLAPGPNSADEIEDGGVIARRRDAARRSTSTSSSTPSTRRRETGLQQFDPGAGHLLRSGRAPEAEQSLRYLSPALSATSRLTRELVVDDEVFERFVTDTSKAVGAIAERRERPGGAGAATRTPTAARDRRRERGARAQRSRLLPGTLRKANTTFVNLRAALDDLDVLVAESKPATKDLARFFAPAAPAGRGRAADDPRPAHADPHARARTTT